VLTKLLKLTSIGVIIRLVGSPAFAVDGGSWLMAGHDFRNTLLQIRKTLGVVLYEGKGMDVLPLGPLPVARKVVLFL
jgi:hypothetical protein